MVDQVIQSIVDWISIVPPLGIYLIFFAVAYLENVLPPVPGDVLIAFAGYLAADGLIELFPIWSITVVASVIGFMNMYWFGYKLGSQIDNNREEHFLLRFINYRYFRKGKIWMYRYGQWVVVANRFLAGTRSVISMTAGMSHLNVKLTIVNSLISSALWNAALLGLGWFIRDNWMVIGEYLSGYGKVIMICIGLVVLARFFWLKRVRREQPEE
ncbi:MAG: DedA family protein [Balneolaceae bacterium]